MILNELCEKKLIHPPKWLPDNTVFLTQMGSVAYGVSTDNSDMDIYGFCVPPKDLVFPHLSGEIPGFGRQLQRFEQWQEHHVNVPEWRKEYDFSIYSIVKFFQLCMENNPNMVDALFVPRRCILHSTPIYEVVREKQKLFLHKGAWHKFKGYAYSQLHKIHIKTNAQNEKRAESIREHGYDLKFAYHVVRLLGEVEQILVEHDLDIQRNREQLKSIRRGEWTLEQIETYFADKERDLEKLYLESTLPMKPDEDALKQLLIDCLEHHYGDLSTTIVREHSLDAVLRDFQSVIDRYTGNTQTS